METYYDLLKVSKEATYEEIKKSYFELISHTNPHTHTANKDFSFKFDKLNRAYYILIDPKSREIYDEGLLKENES